MERFSDRLSLSGGGIEASKTLAVTALARKLKSEGRDILSLTAGEPDFRTPAHVADAGVEAIQSGATRYTAAAGEPALREAVARNYSARWDRELRREQVCVSSGAKPLLYYLMSVLLDPGDEVLYPRPFWVSYEAMVKMRSGRPKPIETRLEEGLKLKAADLDASVTDRSKLLLLNNPTNPTGAVYSRKELLELAEVVRDRDLLVISDEIYEDLLYGDLSHQSLYTVAPWMPERTVVVSGVSKSFAMTGWRLGYALGDPAIIVPLANYQSQALSSPSQISQRAALAAMDGPREPIEAMRLAFEERRNLVCDFFSATGFPFVDPQGAFYLFFDTSPVLEARGWEDGNRFCSELIEEEGVVLVPGDAFGMPNYARLSFAASEDDLRSAFERLGRFFR